MNLGLLFLILLIVGFIIAYFVTCYLTSDCHIEEGYRYYICELRRGRKKRAFFIKGFGMGEANIKIQRIVKQKGWSYYPYIDYPLTEITIESAEKLFDAGIECY